MFNVVVECSMSPSYGASQVPLMRGASTISMVARGVPALRLPIGGVCRGGVWLERVCRNRLVVFVQRSRLMKAAAKPRKVEQEFYDDSDDERESMTEDSDNMVLLVQLVRNILRKMSVRATRAARAMLPPVFSSDLISFFVNGALLLTVFWVAKALLEVVCSMGGMMFSGLLVVRSVWSILTYLQTQRYDSSSGNSNNGSSGKGNNNRSVDDHQYRVSPS